MIGSTLYHHLLRFPRITQISGMHQQQRPQSCIRCTKKFWAFFCKIQSLFKNKNNGLLRNPKLFYKLLFSLRRVYIQQCLQFVRFNLFRASSTRLIFKTEISLAKLLIPSFIINLLQIEKLDSIIRLHIYCIIFWPNAITHYTLHNSIEKTYIFYHYMFSTLADEKLIKVHYD